MTYQENALCCEDYCRLRESVGWINFSETQTEKSLTNTLYTVTAEKDNQTVGMGRLIGDGMYFNQNFGLSQDEALDHVKRVLTRLGL